MARLGEALEQDESQSDESPKGVFGNSQGYLRALWTPAVKPGKWRTPPLGKAYSEVFFSLNSVSLSDGALNSSGAQALGASVHALDMAFHDRADSLDVSGPRSLGLYVRVTDTVADRLGFAAELALGQVENLPK